MKRFISLLLGIVMLLSLFACSCEKDEENENVGGNNIPANAEPITLAGRVYKANIDAINIGYDQDQSPSEIEINNLKEQIKIGYRDSVITFTGENSYTLTGTDNKNHDLTVTDCERAGNELMKEIRKKGSINLAVKGDTLSMLIDFYKDRYVTIEYTLVK